MTNHSATRVLIVDDNHDIHDDFAKILRAQQPVDESLEAEAAFFGEAEESEELQLFYDLDHAFQGEEALQLVLKAVKEESPYHFAFVDMRMPPGWDGVETIQRLWEADPQLQVVVCTAYSDYSWTEMVEHLGLNDKVLLLKKPFDNAEVQQIAVTLTEKRRLADLAQAHMKSLEETISQRTAHLRSAHAELANLLHAISSILIGIDSFGNVTRWNEAAQKALDITVEDATGQPFLELPIEWENPAEIERIVGAEKGEACRVEATLTMASGKKRILGLSAYPVGSAGERTGVLLLGADLTERKIVEHQLHQAQKLEAVGQLAAGVAHEINTPMQYLGDNTNFLHNKISKLAPLLESYREVLEVAQQSGNQESLISDTNEKLKKLKVKSFIPQVLEAIEDSRDGVNHVSRIVKAMKEFSHPGHDEKSPLDINKALESAATVSTNEWKYVANVALDLDESIPLVTAFPGEVNQVFLNIIVNAAHAISDATEGGANGKGEIAISTEANDTHVVVKIGDTGTGIPDEIRQKIFDPFFTTKEVGKGTGQGLSIAHSVIVQKHNGALTCESTPGEGTTFTIELPIESGDVADPSSPTETCQA